MPLKFDTMTAIKDFENISFLLLIFQKIKKKNIFKINLKIFKKNMFFTNLKKKNLYIYIFKKFFFL